MGRPGHKKNLYRIITAYFSSVNPHHKRGSTRGGGETLPPGNAQGEHATRLAMSKGMRVSILRVRISRTQTWSLLKTGVIL